MESNNNKSNLLKNSAIVASLILATAGVSLALVKSNDNKKLIKNNETEKAKLVQALKDLKKANEAKSKALENQLESEKRALEGKLALKTTTEALNNELTNVKTELTNKDLTKAFNKLFKATPEYTTSFNAYKASEFIKTDEYTDALKAYKVSEFKKSPKYMNDWTAYKFSQFKKSPEYTKAFKAYKISQFKNSPGYKGALSAWTKNTKNEQLKTAFIDTETYKDLLEGHNQNPQLATKFKETPEYTTLLNTYKVSQFKKSPEYTKVLKNWRNSEVKKKNDELEALYKKQLEATKQKLSLVEFKNTRPDKLPTEQKALNLIFNEELFESKTEYTKALNAFVVNNSEFIKTNAYKTLLDTFKGKKTSEEWKTAFIKTSKYKTPFNAFNVSEHEFIQTKAYKDALIKYLFSFKGKLDALTGALNTQKTDLEGKLEAQKTQLEGKINDKADITALNTQKSDLEGKINDKADITALEATKTELTTKLTTSELLAEIKGLTFDEALKTKLTTALNEKFGEYTKSTQLTKTKLTELLNDVFARKDFTLTDAQKVAIKQALNADNAFKASIKGTDGTNGQNGAAGKSAYDLWKEQAGNSEKTQQEFLASLKGEQGQAGTTPDVSTLATRTTLSEYLKQSEFINKLIKVLDKTKTTGTEEEVKSVINQMVEDKLIKYAFDKLVQEFKGLGDITNDDHLSNTDGTKNSFYKLAPFLFESPAKANEKLNELLEGNIRDKQDKLAIWKVGDTNDWKIGTLNDLISQNDQKYHKAVYVRGIQNKWKWAVITGENVYTPASAVETTTAPAVEPTQTASPVVDTPTQTPADNKNQSGSGSGGGKDQK